MGCPQRAEAEGEDEREERAVLGEAGVVIEFLIGVVGASDVGHHAKHGERGEQVGEEVEINRTDSHRSATYSGDAE